MMLSSTYINYAYLCIVFDGSIAPLWNRKNLKNFEEVSLRAVD